MTDAILDDVLRCAEAGDLEPLIYKLKYIEAPLTDGERQFIAEYLSGEIVRAAHRPKASPRIRWEAFAILDIILCEERKGGTRTYAKELAAKVCGLDKRTVDRKLKNLLPGDEEQRRKRLEEFHAKCDELEKAKPGRGQFHRRVTIDRIESGASYRAAIVRTKTS